MTIDLIIFIVIAAFLVHRLYSVLGTHQGEDRRPPVNPFAEPAAPIGRPDLPADTVVPLTQQQILDELPEDAPASLEEALIHIARLDPYFDLKAFKEGAGDAYALIVKAYAEGDRQTLKPLLSAKLYDDFDRGITARDEARHVAFSEIRAIKDAQIVDARLEKKTAYLTVRFTAEELSYTCDEDGKVVEGSKTRATDMTDVWTFARDMRSTDPNWILVETRSEE